MIGLLAPAIGFVVLYLLLRAVVRTWPPPSRLGGYANWRGGEAEHARSLDEERGLANREDDDVRWNWATDETAARAGQSPR